MRLLTVMVGLALWISALWAQNLPSASEPGSSVQNGTIRLTSPAMDDHIAQTFVHVQYELVNPGTATSHPAFHIRLDDRDPVTTTTTDHTFSGLRPGAHSVTVALADNNGKAMQGSSTTARFTIVQSRDARQSEGSQVVVAQNDRPAQGTGDGSSGASSALPILSVIGFGVLVGGIFSAMRSR